VSSANSTLEKQPSRSRLYYKLAIKEASNMGKKKKKKSAFCWEGANLPANKTNLSYVGVVECISAWGMENFPRCFVLLYVLMMQAL
jgi:hypothetical protein